jgi:choline-sulfatase
MPAPVNVLFILADDLGCWALGCAGNKEVRTPHLDRLAARGMLFENAFCVSPVCSPARASILTGRIPSQHGVHDWIRRGNSPGESPSKTVIEYLAGQPAYTDILARHGYVCGLSGKWHLGNAPQPQKSHVFWEVHGRGAGPYYHAPLIKKGEEYREPRYVTDVFTDNALEFLRQRRGKSEPFYLGVHYTAPHGPWDRSQHPAEFFDPYYNDCPFASVPDLPLHPRQINTATPGHTPEQRREFLSGYYAAITAMDAGIGRLLDQLEADGRTNDTLVVFTGDNGMNMGHHGIYGKGNGTFPQNMYDTSVKVPLIMSCPGRIPAGSVCDALVSHYDFLPTLLDFVGFGADIPAGLPGASLTGLLRGEAREGNDEVIVFDEYGPVHMIRTAKWKYVHHFPDGPHELYHLENDPGEDRNMIDSDEHQAMAAELRGRLETWFARHVDARFDGRALAVTGKGQLDRVDTGSGKLFEDDWVYVKTKTQQKS